MTDEGHIEGYDPDESTAEAVFSILGNETRLSILLSLWEAEETPLSFSALEDRIGSPDRGNFNYHLSQLTDRFVRSREAGYDLAEPGRQVARAVLSGIMVNDVTLDGTAIDDQCPYCGGTVELAYENDVLSARCTECVGVVGAPDTFPVGTYLHFGFPPAGLTDRSPREILEAAHVFYDSKITPMIKGVCPECAGQVESCVDVCRDHDGGPDRLCPDCETIYRCWVQWDCTHCGYARRSPIWFSVMNHPIVIAFYAESGVFEESVPFSKLTRENIGYTARIDERVRSEEPLRLEITIPYEDRELVVVVDENQRIVDSTRR